MLKFNPIAGTLDHYEVGSVTSVNTRTGAVTGLAEASDLTAHTGNTSNPHSVTKAQVGLSNADNTADSAKPISTATQTALDGKFTQRTITGTANQITVTNGNGVSGNPTLSLPSAITTPGTLVGGGLITASAGFVANGIFRYDKQSADVYSGGLIVRKRGTTGDATAGVANNSEIGYHSFEGWDGTSAHKRLAYVIVKADGATTPTTGGGHYRINVRDSAGTEADRLLITSAGTAPGQDSTYTLGTSALYWSNTYTDRLYLNSTFNINGAVAGTGNITGNLGILATSGSATHSLTLGSTATGIALYNTSDQTTNYERVRHFYNSGIYYIAGEWGGTGIARTIRISPFNTNFNGGLQVNASATSTGFVQSQGSSSFGDIAIHQLSGTHSAASGVQYGMRIAHTINQTSTAGYTALLINPTETATGSGVNNLIDLQVGGNSLFRIASSGLVFLGNNIYINNASGIKIGTATTQKLGFYNATPVVQPASTPANATDLDTALTLVNDLKSKLVTLGLIA